MISVCHRMNDQRLPTIQTIFIGDSSSLLVAHVNDETSEEKPLEVKGQKLAEGINGRVPS